MSWKQKVLDLCGEEKKLIFDKIEKYINLILEYNKKFNLIGFDEETLWKDGIYQSIMLLNSVINLNKDHQINLLDIGAGCGLPSMPFFLFTNEAFNLTIIDSNSKRIKFLEIVKQELEIENLTLVNKRAEEIKELNEKFDYITARAVAPLNVLLEISSSFGKINSEFLFLKSSSINEEIEKSNWIINQLKITNYETLNINIGDEKNHIIFKYKKINKTPHGFPRKWSLIKK